MEKEMEEVRTMKRGRNKKTQGERKSCPLLCQYLSITKEKDAAIPGPSQLWKKHMTMDS